MHAVDTSARNERASAVATQIRHGVADCTDALQTTAARLQRIAGNDNEVATLRQSIETSRFAAANVDACVRDLQLVAVRLGEGDRLRRLLEAELQDIKAILRQTQVDMQRGRVREADAHYAALHDSLTGLPNRKLFADRSCRTLAEHDTQQKRFALLFIDLDGFKTINDTHGHAVGDGLLQAVGSRLSRAVRAEDTISRHGGDEFVCLLQDIDNDVQVDSVARKLFDAVAAPYRLHDLVLTIAPSIGIALFPRDGSTVETLLEHADKAMFWAKQHRLGFHFHRASLAPQRQVR